MNTSTNNPYNLQVSVSRNKNKESQSLFKTNYYPNIPSLRDFHRKVIWDYQDVAPNGASFVDNLSRRNLYW